MTVQLLRDAILKFLSKLLAVTIDDHLLLILIEMSGVYRPCLLLSCGWDHNIIKNCSTGVFTGICNLVTLTGKECYSHNSKIAAYQFSVLIRTPALKHIGEIFSLYYF